MQCWSQGVESKISPFPRSVSSSSQAGSGLIPSSPLVWDLLWSWDLGGVERLKGSSLDFGTSCPPLTPPCTFPGLNQAQPLAASCTPQHPVLPAVTLSDMDLEGFSRVWGRVNSL